LSQGGFQSIDCLLQRVEDFFCFCQVAGTSQGLELPGSVAGLLSGEVGQGALERMGGTVKLLGILPDECLPDFFQEAGRIVQEQLDYFAQQFLIPVNPRP
jgi:hypothetical protein